MPSSFDLRDWVGFAPESDDPGWRSRATSWYNELVAAVRTHLTDAGWTKGGLTFSRNATNTNTRISDYYSVPHQKYINNVRVSFDSTAAFSQYEDDGSTGIGRWDRAQGYLYVNQMPTGTFSFATNWEDYGGSYATTTISKSSNGIVHLEGLVRRTSSTSTSGDTMFTLPTWARPQSRRIYECPSASGTIRVDINTTGTVTALAAVPANDWVSVSGLNFRHVDWDTD